MRQLAFIPYPYIFRHHIVFFSLCLFSAIFRTMSINLLFHSPITSRLLEPNIAKHPLPSIID